MRLLLPILILLGGCSSVAPKDEHQDRRLDNVEYRLKHLGTLFDHEMVGNAKPDPHKGSPAADQWGLQPEISEVSRLKNHLRIMDDTFSDDIRYLQGKLQTAERTIAAQAVRIKVLEDKQPLVEPMPAKQRTK